MLGNWVLLSVLGLLSYSARAESLGASFKLEGATAWEAKQLETCISYSDCGAIANVIPNIDGVTGLPNGKFQVAVSGMNEFGVSSKLALCGIGKQLNGKLRRADGSAVSLVGLETPLLTPPRPAFLYPNFFDETTQDKLQELLLRAMSGDIKVASAHLMDLFEMPEPRYKVEIKYPEGHDVTTTDHGLREVEISPRYSSPCEFWWVMRHEMEHVAQIRFADQCLLKGKAHLYEFQRFRELSAYLGDMAYASVACDSRYQNGIQLNAVYNIDRYLRMSLPKP